MDIKEEPQWIIDPVVEQDIEWQHYKKEFEENRYVAKAERYCSEDTANIADKLTCQEVTMNLGKIKSEKDSICGEKNERKTFRIKAEAPEEEKSAYENTVKTQPVYSSTATPNPPPHSERHASETVVKEELAPPEEVKGADFLKCGDNCDLQPRYPVPSLIARMKLHRVPFYKRNFICDVCFDIFPTMSENKLHKRIHKQSTNQFVDERLISQEPFVGFVNVKSENNSTCVERTPEFRIKIENPDAEEPYSDSKPITPQIHTAIRPVCSTVTSSSLTPQSDIRIDEMDIKKELTYFEYVDNSLLNDCSYDCEFRSYSLLSGLVARIRLNRIPFYIRNFVCNVCYEIFPTVAEQKFHKFDHNQLPCRTVNRKFCGRHHLKHSVFGNIRPQKKYSSVDNQFKCEDCGFSCGYLWILRRHRLSHLKDKPFKCDECEYACIYYTAMKRHKMVHSGEKPFQCPDCDYSCILYGRMKEHRMIHTGEKPLKCEECDYSSIYSNNMKKHKMIHSGEKPLKCDKCEYSCIQSTNMKQHKMMHFGVKPFSCEECHFSSVSATVINKHKLVHTVEKPFKCTKCKYACKRFSDLKYHNKIHSGVSPFKCEECDYSTIYLGLMKKHKMFHSGEKPFKCGDCDYSTIIPGHLKAHKMIHSGEKPFKCDLCSYACRRTNDLKRHKTIHIGVKTALV